MNHATSFSSVEFSNQWWLRFKITASHCLNYYLHNEVDDWPLLSFDPPQKSTNTSHYVVFDNWQLTGVEGMITVRRRRRLSWHRSECLFMERPGHVLWWPKSLLQQNTDRVNVGFQVDNKEQSTPLVHFCTRLRQEDEHTSPDRMLYLSTHSPAAFGATYPHFS